MVAAYQILSPVYVYLLGERLQKCLLASHFLQWCTQNKLKTFQFMVLWLQRIKFYHL